MTMHFSISCERTNFLLALQAAEAVVPSNSAKPILTNLLLRVEDGILEIVATDQQVGLRAVLRQLEIVGEGEVIVPARQLVNILKESASPTVQCTVQEDGGRSEIVVALADGHYNIPAVVGESFPAVSHFPAEGDRITLAGPDLESMIHQTAFAVDRDRTSAVLSGVYVAVNQGEFVMAATNSMVLCESVLRDERFDQEMTAIVPAVTINHLNRIIGSAKPQQVEICVSAKLIFIRVVIGSGKTGGAGNIQVELTSRLVEGTYPAYRNALPPASEVQATFDARELASAVRRTALMTSNASRAIVMNIEDGKSMLSNLNNTSGSAEVPVRCTFTGSGETKIGLNATYLTDVLRVYDGDEISIELNGPGKGLIMHNKSVTFLIMPIRVHD